MCDVALWSCHVHCQLSNVSFARNIAVSRNAQFTPAIGIHFVLYIQNTSQHLI